MLSFLQVQNIRKSSKEIEETKDLSKELSQKIVEIAEEFKKEQVLMYGKYQRNTDTN